MRRSFKRPTMEDIRGEPFRPRNGSNGLGERWRTRRGRCSWKESTIRLPKVEINGGAVGERAQLVEEEERKKRELSESGKAKT